jgi:hypothetical protein
MYAGVKQSFPFLTTTKLALGTTQPLPNELLRAQNFASTFHIRLHGMVLGNKRKIFQQTAPEIFFQE